MVSLSFLANLAVLLAVLAGQIRRGGVRADPARQAWAALCVTLVCASLAGLVFADKAGEIAHTLFPLQILWTLILPVFAGWRSRLVWGAALLAALHLATMLTLYT